MQRLISRCYSSANKFKLKPFLVRFNSTDVNNNNEGLGVAYSPKLIEDDFRDINYFKAESKTDKKFTIILPPPNITGILHLGHALAVTVEDVLVRWHKMRGYETLWIPGFDHAGIATQVVVEKKLWKERGLSRHDIGRDEFVKEIWKWKSEKADVIGQQLRRLGASLDWPRQMFTMDAGQSLAVTEAFIKLYDADLIYRSDYLVNWSCVLRSAISDIEVEHLEVLGRTEISVPGYEKPVEFGRLIDFAYKLSDASGLEVDEIVVSTTRPETMMGDVAVAVHPQDTRYSSLIGRTLLHPFRNDRIPVIPDEFVDPEFGTGAVKVTPAHDHNDFAVGKRHSLPSINAIGEDGNLTSSCGQFAGLRRFEARAILVAELGKLNLLRGDKDHKMIVPICSRSKDVVEFLPKPQWFIRCKGMASRALEEYRSGALSIEPEQFGKNWTSWLENIRDWCVSRQLWWGHQVPVYFCTASTGNEGSRNVCVAARSPEEAKSKAAIALSCPKDAIEVVRDEDVLDTWFSSALLPFSALGWPQQTDDLQKYYPLSMMETGHDILFFWVARMVMLGTELTGQLPFSKILLHGIVCDAQGRKMSKSLGNVVAPEDVIYGRTLQELEGSSRDNFDAGILTEEELKKALAGQKKMFPDGIADCGADALRFTLCSHNIKNHFINFDIQECKVNKFFGNKIWQAVKFANKWMEQIAASQEVKQPNYASLSNIDKWILSRLSSTVKTVNEAFEKHEFHNATSSLKNFMYYDFCDIYLEAAKRELRNPITKEAAEHCWTMSVCLETSLRCIAPFMPRLAQHLHERLFEFPFIVRRFDFPKEVDSWIEPRIEKDISRIMDVVVSIRRVKKLFNVTGKHKPKVILETGNVSFIGEYLDVIQDLSACEATILQDRMEPALLSKVVSDKVEDVTVHLMVPDDLRQAFEVDLQKTEKKRLKLSAELEKLQRLTSSEAYRRHASEKTLEVNARKITTLEEKIARIDYMHSFSSRN